MDLEWWWDGERVLYSRGAFEDGDLAGSIASSLVATWRFVRFSDSRWLTLGTSARTLVAALLTGIRGLLDAIYADKNVSKLCFGGFPTTHDFSGAIPGERRYRESHPRGLPVRAHGGQPRRSPVGLPLGPSR